MYEVTIKKMFSAAHKLEEIGGNCEKLHGHNFLVEVSVVSEELTETGLLIDFRDLKRDMSEVLESLDHKCLNELSVLDGINPSAENIARFIHKALSTKINDARLTVSKVTVWESDDARVTYS